MSRFARDNNATSLREEVFRVAKVAQKITLMAQCYVAIQTELHYEVQKQRCTTMYANGIIDVRQVEWSIVFRVASRFQGHVANFLVL